jgi:hypothetical protein
VRDNPQDCAGPTRFLRVSNDRDKLLVGGKLVWRVRTKSGDPDFHELEPDGELATPTPGAPTSRIVKPGSLRITSADCGRHPNFLPSVSLLEL